jgi:hypothetical protein
MLPLASRSLETAAHALAEHVPLEFREDSEHAGEGASAWRR